MKYISLTGDDDEKKDLLAVSTEDGRVIFYSTTILQDAEGEDSTIPYASPVAQVGGKQAGLPGRIKDFEVLGLEEQAADIRNDLLVVTGNSDGVVRVWKVNGKSLVPGKKSKGSKESRDTRQTGTLLTTYETGNRITCLAAFIMLPAEDPSTLFDSAEEESEEEEEESESDDDDE